MSAGHPWDILEVLFKFRGTGQALAGHQKKSLGDIMAKCVMITVIFGDDDCHLDQ